MDEEMHFTPIRLHFMEFRWLWTSTRPAHGAAQSAGYIHSICIFCSMLVVQHNCTILITEQMSNTLNVQHSLKLKNSATAHMICKQCIPCAVNLQLVKHQIQYTALVLQSCAYTVECRLVSFSTAYSSLRTVTVGAQRGFPCLLYRKLTYASKSSALIITIVIIRSQCCAMGWNKNHATKAQYRLKTIEDHECRLKLI